MSLDDIAKIASALASSRRLRIITALCRPGGVSVKVLADAMALPSCDVSKHLRVLRDAGLVKVDRIRKYRVYSLTSMPVNGRLIFGGVTIIIKEP